MQNVFISYSHTDHEIADNIVSVLEELSIPYFRDIKNIRWGDAIPASVRDGLSSSSAIIVIISPGSLKSDWVPYEVGYATARGINILPFLTHPAIETPAFIYDLSYVETVKQVREYFISYQSEPHNHQNTDQKDITSKDELQEPTSEKKYSSTQRRGWFTDRVHAFLVGEAGFPIDAISVTWSDDPENDIATVFTDGGLNDKEISILIDIGKNLGVQVIYCTN